jgi:hypothetical protein
MVEHIVNSGLLIKGNFDLFDSYQHFHQDQVESKISHNKNKEDPISESKKQSKEIESIISNLPKNSSNNRLTYQIISFFLNSLVEEKMNLDIIASEEIQEKLKDSLISKGLAFGEVNQLLAFDKELHDNFDERSLAIIKQLHKSKIIRIKERKLPKYSH